VFGVVRIDRRRVLSLSILRDLLLHSSST
jgi:hypothetical protein